MTVIGSLLRCKFICINDEGVKEDEEDEEEEEEDKDNDDNVEGGPRPMSTFLSAAAALCRCLLSGSFRDLGEKAPPPSVCSSPSLSA